MSAWSGTLVLGGGGARGLAHIGAIAELAATGFVPDRIVGVSIGSLVGALVALEPSIVRVERLARDYLQSAEFARIQRRLRGAGGAPDDKRIDAERSLQRRSPAARSSRRVLSRAARQRSILSGALLEQVVDQLLPDIDIADSRIPLAIAAVDLHTGAPVLFDKGSLRLAVQASASIPGIFPPIEHEGRLLCDMGVYDPLPLDIARPFEHDLLVAVDVASNLRPLSPGATALDVLIRMNEIASQKLRENRQADADLLIEPVVGDVAWFDFTRADTLLEAGRRGARAALSEWWTKPVEI